MVIVGPICVFFGSSLRSARVSMTRASYCYPVSLLIVLMVMKLALASLNTLDISASLSSSSSSSTNSSLSPAPSSVNSSSPLAGNPVAPPTFSKRPLNHAHHSSHSQSGEDTSTREQADTQIIQPLTDAMTSTTTEDSVQTTPTASDNAGYTTPTSSGHRGRTPPTSSNLRDGRTDTNDISPKAKLKAFSDKDKQKLHAMEQNFLKNMGLQKRPTVGKDFAVPEFMLDLYKTHSANHLRVKGNGLLAANTVRSFVHTDAEHTKCRPPLCALLHFDISSISEHETVTGAELRIFADTQGISLGDRDSSRSPPVDSSVGAVAQPNGKLTLANTTTHRIEVYEVMRPESPECEAITRLLDTRVVNFANATWESFNIQPAVLKWKRGANHGLEVRISSTVPVLSTDNHIRARRAVHLADHEWSLQRPILVTYSDDKQSPSSSSSSSASATSQPSKKPTTRLRRLRTRRNADARMESRSQPRKKKKKKNGKRTRKGKKNVCKRHPLYVNFAEVGWNDWIVAPVGYNAFFCQGECMLPLPDFLRPSNHAMLQARVYKVHPGSVPMVCCVPTKMSPISMLYRDEKGRTVLKNYQDMAVEECGCI